MIYFQIRNNGPSNVKSLDVIISLPISYVNLITLERENIIDTSSVSIKSMYNDQQFNVEWVQNNTILVLDAIESTSTTISTASVADYNGMQFDASKIGLEYDLSGGNQNNDNIFEERRRRSAEFNGNTLFSPYLQKIIQTDQTFDRYRRDIFNTNDHLLSYLPKNRTIFFDCTDTEEEFCLQGKFTVSNFKKDNTPILVMLNFTVDMSKISKCTFTSLVAHQIHRLLFFFKWFNFV